MTADDAPLLTIALAPGAWSHPRLAWWAVQMRLWGYRGPLPAWAVVTCQAVYPARQCRCGLYRVCWGEWPDA